MGYDGKESLVSAYVYVQFVDEQNGYSAKNVPGRLYNTFSLELLKNIIPVIGAFGQVKYSQHWVLGPAAVVFHESVR